MKIYFSFKRKRHRRFKELMYPFYGDLYRFAYSRLGNKEDAEDTVQETFVKAYRAFESFNDQANPKAWLSCILINIIRDHVRKSTRSPRTVPFDQANQSESPHLAIERAHLQDPAQAASKDEVDPVLLEALNELPDTFLNPLLLREIHDCSYQEIATYMDIPMGTVMSRLSRARNILKERLQGSFRPASNFSKERVDSTIPNQSPANE